MDANHDLRSSSVLLPGGLVLALAALLTAQGCPSWDTRADDDTGGGDDDDATGDDDTQPPGDACDDYPGEVICEGETALTCDAQGDVAATEDCTLTPEFYCFWGLGCVTCYPGTTWCDGDDVVVCAPDGQAGLVQETCDVAAGYVCDGGACVSLCDQAEQARSSIGCTFFGVDMEQNHDAPTEPYAVVVSNVHESLTASVTAERKSGGAWSVYEQASIGPRDLHAFEFPSAEIPNSGLGSGYSYRIRSTIPVIAYQFNPLDGSSSYTTDASLLLPTSAWDIAYIVPGWGSQYGHGSVNVVAKSDGTQVIVTPSAATISGTGVPAGQAGVPMAAIALDEGDVLQISSNNGVSLEGTTVEATSEVGVFAGNQCANIPTSCTACDHIEEQVFGLQTWGVEYIGARLPPRSASPEDSYWHLVAGASPTTLTFQAAAGVTGLPPGNTLTLQAGESYELHISGSASDPGDFLVTGTEAFLASQYMIGASCAANIGDPCMVQAVPIEQYLDNYVVLVPSSWVNDKMTVTRTPGDSVTIDGTPIDLAPGAQASTVAGLYEVVRFDVSDGTHVLEGDGPFAVQVVGYDSWDSYCYPGGLDQQIINDL